jgi:hypothetical protein
MEKITMTLQELTDELQTLCHNGHAQKTVLLVMLKDGKPHVAIPYKNDNKFIVSEESVAINFGEF